MRWWLVLGVVTVIGVLVVIGRRWLERGFYEPGRIAAIALEPAGRGPEGFWQVEPDVRLRHFEVGQGGTIVYVHGGPGMPPSKPWAVADALAGTQRSVFFHARGCGESTCPIDRAGPGNTYERMQRVEARLGLGAQVADVERVRRGLGEDRLVLLGHSFGALVAALYAAEFPDRVRALVLVAPANLVQMPKDADLFSLVAARLPAAEREAFARWQAQSLDFTALLERDEASLSELYSRFGHWFGVATGTPLARTPDGVAGGWLTVATYLSLGRRHDWSEAIGRVKAPVLLVHGAKDLVPVEETRDFARFFPNARVEVIDAVGHFVPDDAPEALAALVRNFLAANP